MPIAVKHVKDCHVSPNCHVLVVAGVFAFEDQAEDPRTFFFQVINSMLMSHGAKLDISLA